MRKNISAVIDIGSSKITSIISERGVNNTFVVKGYAEYDYDGFSDGVFFDEDSLRCAIVNTLDNVIKDSRLSLEEVFVGVPGEFAVCVNKSGQISFPSKRKISDKDIDELYDSVFSNTSNNYSIINRSSIYYTLDDNRRILNAKGQVSERLGGNLSYILVENSFVKIIKNIIDKNFDLRVEFISASLAEGLYLFEQTKRDRFVMLCDIGYISSSLMIIRGDGLIFLKSFSLGGGHIEAKLMEFFNVPYHISKKLKKVIDLGVIRNIDDVYIVEDKNDTYTYSAQDVNETAKYCLDEICEMIEECLRECNEKYPDYTPLVITGGGVSYIRGAKEYMASKLNRVVELASPEVPHMNKPTMSSTLGLLDLSLKRKEIKAGMFKKILGRFGG